MLDDAKTHDDDPSLSFFDDDMSCSDKTFLSDDKSLSYEESNVIEELFQSHVATSSTLKEGPSDYVCFTTTQKCVTSLMLLLDSMECPDYASEEMLLQEFVGSCNGDGVVRVEDFLQQGRMLQPI